MNRLASPAQLRASLIRWSLFLVPSILLLGLLSGLAGGDASSDPWFTVLEKPAIFPPVWVFPIVWPILYAMMGFAMAIVCAAWGSHYRLPAILAFIVQLALNLAWSPIFFAGHDIALAFAVIVALSVAVILTILLFWSVRRAAALLMLPYLAWIIFAALLNWQFLQLNPGAGRVEVTGAAARFEL